MSVSPFIPDDGYTETAYIAAVPRVHSAAKIKYRPTPIEDRADLLSQIRTATMENDERKVAKMMIAAVASRIVSWEFFDDNGKRIEDGIPAVNADSVRKIRPSLFARLEAIVFYGTDGGDVPPKGGDNNPPDTEGDQKN